MSGALITHGRGGRPLKYPRIDWISDPTGSGIPAFESEFVFHKSRMWRFDYAWPEQRVALEVDGGAGKFGRHSRPGGMRKDHEKINAAQLLGWKVLRALKGEELRVGTLELIRKALNCGASGPVERRGSPRHCRRSRPGVASLEVP